MDEVTPDSAETQHLLEQVRAGDRGAFEKLFGQFRGDLCRFVELRLDPKLRPRVDASDVVQETQLEVFQRLADYLERRPMPFRLWLRKTAYERLEKIRRRHVETSRRTVEREVPLPDQSSLLLAQKILAEGSTPSQQLSRKELVPRLRRALSQLPEADREVLLLRTVEGLSYQEVGYLLGIEPATARKRQARALVRLHRILFEGGLTESQL
jgi:RNA polymerase sigma-70 factor (ECF subfamily)